MYKIGREQKLKANFEHYSNSYQALPGCAMFTNKPEMHKISIDCKKSKNCMNNSTIQTKMQPENTTESNRCGIPKPSLSCQVAVY